MCSPATPDEIVAEIITYLPFDSVNTAARICAQFARVVSRMAIGIANKNAKYCCGCHRLADRSVEGFFQSWLLPNGKPHGVMELFQTGFDPVQDRHVRTDLFRVTYVLGIPTYWRLREPDTRYCHRLYKWGHMSSPYYVDGDYVDGSGEVCANIQIGKHEYLSCDEIRAPICWQTRDGKLYRAANFVAADRTPILPPAKLVVDGKMCLDAVESWGRQILCAAIKRWPNLKLRDRYPAFFEDDQRLAAVIRGSFPGMSGLNSPIWAPKWARCRR